MRLAKSILKNCHPQLIREYFQRRVSGVQRVGAVGITENRGAIETPGSESAGPKGNTQRLPARGSIRERPRVRERIPCAI